MPLGNALKTLSRKYWSLAHQAIRQRRSELMLPKIVHHHYRSPSLRIFSWKSHSKLRANAETNAPCLVRWNLPKSLLWIWPWYTNVFCSDSAVTWIKQACGWISTELLGDADVCFTALKDNAIDVLQKRVLREEKKKGPTAPETKHKSLFSLF